MGRNNPVRRTKSVAAVIAIVLLTSACGAKSGTTTNPSAGNNSGPHKKGGTVTIANTQGQTWTCQ